KLYSRRHRLLLLLLTITFVITMPNEPFESSQGGIGAAAHGDDDLLVRTVGGVAGGEHAGHGGFAARAGDDFAHGVEFERAFHEVRIRHQADLHEHAGEFDAMAFAAFTVGVDEAGDPAAIAFDRGGLRRGE